MAKKYRHQKDNILTSLCCLGIARHQVDNFLLYQNTKIHSVNAWNYLFVLSVFSQNNPALLTLDTLYQTPYPIPILSVWRHFLLPLFCLPILLERIQWRTAWGSNRRWCCQNPTQSCTGRPDPVQHLGPDAACMTAWNGTTKRGRLIYRTKHQNNSVHLLIHYRICIN